MDYTRDELKNKLYDAIPIGQPEENNKFYLAPFLDGLRFSGKADRENTRKKLTRLLRAWSEPQRRIVIDSEKRDYSYYWIDAKCRDECLGAFRVMPNIQAVAFHLMENHFGRLLPPQYRHELKNAYESARSKTNDVIGIKDNIELWKEKLVINPLGLPLKQLPLDDNVYAIVYEALGNEQVLAANYSSVHPELNKRTVNDENTLLIFSPQEIRQQGMRLYVLALVQNQSEEPFLKLLSMSKLLDIEKYEKFDYGYKNKIQKEFSCKLRLRIHTIASSYFGDLLLGDDQTIESEGGNSWILSATVKLPQHFANDGPDIFYLCSFLATFSHTVEVISPAAIRKDMKKRADKMAQAYQASSKKGMQLMDSLMDETVKIEDLDIVFLG